MLIALDPTQKWDFELPGQDDVPPEQRIVCECRFLSVGSLLRFRAARAKANDEKITVTDQQYLAAVMESLEIVVVSVRNLPAGAESGARGLLEVATLPQLWEWGGLIAMRQSLAERERKNSESRQPGSQAPSAVNAGQDGACETAAPS